jgi:S1-C subfamily serine protease
MSRWRSLAVAALAVAAVVTTSAAARGGDDEKHVQRNVIRLRQGGGYLGVSLDDVRAEDVKRLGLADERGAVVEEVTGDSPADKAGVKAEDVILSYEGEAVRSAAHLSRLVRETPPGRTVAVGVSRGGSRQELQVKVGEARLGQGLQHLRDMKIEGLEDLRLDALDGLELPVPPQPPNVPQPPQPPAGDVFTWHFPGSRARLGLEVVELTDQLAAYFKVEDGVLVSRVRDGSPAQKAGIRAGDIITGMDGQSVSSARDLARGVGRASTERDVTLTLQRDGRALDVRVRLEPRERRRLLPAPTT